MSQSRAAAVAAVGGVVVGVTVAIVMGLGGGLGENLLGDTESDISLRTVNGECVVGKETVVTVKKGKKITWRVKNRCSGQRTVRVGNFRSKKDSSATNCDNATMEIAWPFNPEDEALEKRQATVNEGQSRNIKLRDAKNAGSSPADFYFDVCLGSVISDPRLVIDP